MSEKIVTKIGWFASFVSIAMYFSYIDQIRLNVSGHPGSIILPVVTAINGSVWITYGLLKSAKDWPIIVANIPAVILGIITAFTAIVRFA